MVREGERSGAAGNPRVVYGTRRGLRVRRSCDQFVVRGGTNLVNLERNYMHGFVAGPNGARGLDITTRIRPQRSTPSLEVGKQPLDEAFGIFEARWTT